MKMVALGGMLVGMTVMDMKWKRVSAMALLACCALGWIFVLYRGDELSEPLMGMIPGAILYLVSVLSHEKIGKGDALLFLCAGIYLGFWKTISLLWISVLLSGIFGAFLILVKKKSPEYEIPFVPFVLCGFLLCLLSWEVWNVV